MCLRYQSRLLSSHFKGAQLCNNPSFSDYLITKANVCVQLIVANLEQDPTLVTLPNSFL